MEFLRKFFRWNKGKSFDTNKNQTSLLLAAFLGLLEDVLFWRIKWLSLSCILFLNVIFLICILQEITFLRFLFAMCITIICSEAFETWLKHKHRTTFLKRLADQDATKLNAAIVQLKYQIRRKWMEFIYLRETNHTKAFLLVNIMLTIIFVIGKYVSGYLLLYMMTMCLCVLHELAPPILRTMKKIKQHADSDEELEGLIPEVSEQNIKLLSVEPEHQSNQSLDYWKPEDVPIDDASDSSDNSSSLVTNLCMEKVASLDKDVVTSDSSDDEYIPLEQKSDEVMSTLEVAQPGDTWTSTAYNAFFNVTGALAHIVHPSAEQSKRKRIPSIESSDGFEMIDQNDLN